MFTRKVIHTLLGAALLAVLASSSIGAISDPARTTYFTFSKAVQLPGVALPAGTYVFQVVNPWTGGDVVVVKSRDRSKVYLLQLTHRIERPLSRDMKARLVLREAPAGQSPAVKSWFADGESTGRAFIY